MAQNGSLPGLTRGRAETATAALLAIATALMLEAVRVFVSYLIFVVDQSQRTTIALAAFTVFAFPFLTALATRFAGPARTLAACVLLLAAGSILIQFIEQPTARILLGGCVVVAWGVLTVVLVASRRRMAGAALVLGLALDLGIRIAAWPLDLPWMPGAVHTIVVLLLALALGALWLLARSGQSIRRTSWRASIGLFAIGPALALHHLVTGNLAFTGIHADLSPAASGALLAGGLVLGIVIAAMRLLAIGASGGSGMLIGRFVLFDAIIGAVSLAFAWGAGGMAILGLLFATVATTELLIFALAADVREEDSDEGDGIWRIASSFTGGMLLQFVLLFLYYTATGSAVMLGIAWAGLVAAAVVSTLTLPASLQAQPIRLRPAALPALAVLVLLVAAPAARALTASDPPAGDVVGDTLRVMTYNIQSGFSKDNHWDLEATARVIETADPDIVLLQEVSRGWLVTTGNDQLRWLSERLDMYYAWGPASTDDLWGNAILSRFPIVSQQVVKYDSTDNLKRSGLVAGIELGDGRILSAIATHLDNPGEAGQARAGQVTQLVELLDTEQPTIVAGDFNATPDDLLIVDMADVGLIDTAPLAGADEPTSEDERRIDYVFVTVHFEVLDGQVVDTDASDHRPLVVNLALP